MFEVMAVLLLCYDAFFSLIVLSRWELVVVLLYSMGRRAKRREELDPIVIP